MSFLLNSSPSSLPTTPWLQAFSDSCWNFFPSPKSLTQNYLSYGHPVPYLKSKNAPFPCLQSSSGFCSPISRVQVLNTAEKAPSIPMPVYHPASSPTISLFSICLSTPSTPGPLPTLCCCSCPHTPEPTGCVQCLTLDYTECHMVNSSM